MVQNKFNCGHFNKKVDKINNFMWNIKLSYKWFVLYWVKTKKSFVSQNYLVSIASLSGHSNGLCWLINYYTI